MTKKVKTSSLLLLATSLSFAGTKEVAPVEAIVIDVQAVESSSFGKDFYLGLGVSAFSLKNDNTEEKFTAYPMTLQLGYNYNKYLGIEGRYLRSLGKVKYDKGNSANTNIADYPSDFTNIALYLKPQYKAKKFTAYALLGYGEVALTNIPQGGVDRAEAGFQWGFGLSYDLTENISTFVDYTNLYDGKGFNFIATDSDVAVHAVTIGFSYRF